jgi:transcriptional regulator with XRE-family HTH domain
MSERSKAISRLLKSRDSREAYIGAKLKVLIPSQIRGLRLKSQTPRQEDLAKAAEMKQSRISAMETPGAVNFNLETLVRIAATLRVALIVKFVPFSEMLRWENEFNQDAFSPATIDSDPEFKIETVLGPAPDSVIGKDSTVGTRGFDLGFLQPIMTGAASGLIQTNPIG